MKDQLAVIYNLAPQLMLACDTIWVPFALTGAKCPPHLPVCLRQTRSRLRMARGRSWRVSLIPEHEANSNCGHFEPELNGPALHLCPPQGQPATHA